MVNDAVTTDAPERALALSYAPRRGRAGLEALFALDDALAQVLRTTTQPLIGAMRLTWWHDALCALSDGTTPAQPVLEALRHDVTAAGVAPERLARIVEGWELLAGDEPLEAEQLAGFATARGATMFEVAGQLLKASPGDPLTEAGTGWALVDLMWHVRDAAVAERARTLAEPVLSTATHARWSRNGRSLGALAHLAKMDLALTPGAARPVGAPARVMRLLRHRLTGR